MGDDITIKGNVNIAKNEGKITGTCNQNYSKQSINDVIGDIPAASEPRSQGNYTHVGKVKIEGDVVNQNGNFGVGYNKGNINIGKHSNVAISQNYWNQDGTTHNPPSSTNNAAACEEKTQTDSKQTLKRSSAGALPGKILSLLRVNNIWSFTIFFIVTYAGAVAALWGAVEAYTYFKGDALREMLGSFGVFIFYGIPLLPAFGLALFKSSKKVAADK